jgi:hypothetical protein
VAEQASPTIRTRVSPTIRAPAVVVAPAAVEALVAEAEAEVTPVAVEAKSPNTGLAAKRAKLVERGLVRI